MRIDLNTGISPTFYGIYRPYESKGRTIIPISTVPSDEEVAKAINSTKGRSDSMEGYNGRAYFLGEDLVIKHYKGKDAFSNDPSREIYMLDRMFDHDLRFNNSQVGSYAVYDKDGEVYLVSSAVKGEEPDAKSNPFNKYNLEELVEIITQMDTGANFEKSSRHDYSDKCRFMNYDFNGGNIKITYVDAGLFDFEYAEIENIDDMIFEKEIHNRGGANCHRSDTSALPSSLRSFEFYSFCYYLKKSDKPKALFNDYLQIKAKYHQNMAKFYEDYSKESKFPEKTAEIAKKELAHARLLNGFNNEIPEDIMKSEALKIQMANFIHEQSPSSSTGEVNPKQIREYTESSVDYFAQNLKKAIMAGDIDRQIYYKDCIDAFCDWSKVDNWMNHRIKEKKEEGLLKKLTDKHITTLDEILGL